MSTATMTTVVVVHAWPRGAESMPKIKTSKPRSDVVALAPFTLPLVGTTALRTTHTQSRIQQLTIPGHNQSQRWCVTGPPPSQAIWSPWEARKISNGNEDMHVVHANLNEKDDPTGGTSDNTKQKQQTPPLPDKGNDGKQGGSSPGGGGADEN